MLAVITFVARQLHVWKVLKIIDVSDTICSGVCLASNYVGLRIEKFLLHESISTYCFFHLLTWMEFEKVNLTASERFATNIFFENLHPYTVDTLQSGAALHAETRSFILTLSMKLDLTVWDCLGFQFSLMEVSCGGVILWGAPSECCPTGRQSSENRMTEWAEEGRKKREGGVERSRRGNCGEEGVQQKYGGLTEK